MLIKLSSTLTLSLNAHSGQTIESASVNHIILRLYFMSRLLQSLKKEPETPYKLVEPPTAHPEPFDKLRANGIYLTKQYRVPALIV